MSSSPLASSGESTLRMHEHRVQPPKQEVEQHTIRTMDNNGVAVDLQVTIIKEGKSFRVRGDNVAGHPVSFVNYYGENYESSVVLGLSAVEHGGESVLFGEKGYIKFHSVGDVQDFTGQEITYSTIE